ncbi:MAG: hypothetical protein AAF404_08705, partial [Pseudomonadota bacterium]
MANNVDLMVVGAADGISAAELSQRLIKEFGQPAEAFVDLVAAACEGGAKYAAQSGVTLDTAVEGQGKLEDLGVVCELVVDGEVVPRSGLSRGQSFIAKQTETAAQPESSEQSVPPESAVEQKQAADDDAAMTDDPTEADEASGKEETPEADPDSADIEETTEGLESSVDLPALGEQDSSSTDTPDNTPATDTDDFEVCFSDELDSLDSAIPSTKADDASANDNEAAEETVDFDDISFDLNDDDSTSAAEPADDGEAVSAEPAIADGAATDSDELSVDDNAEPLSLAAENSLESNTEPKAADHPLPAGASTDSSLELSLSLDNDTPLTKPKKKSDVIPDDGGLTLVSADDTAAPTPIPGVKIGNDSQADDKLSSDSDMSISLEDDAVDTAQTDITETEQAPAPELSLDSGTEPEVDISETPDLLACGFLTHEGETRELIIDPSTW